jgi:two-component system response regulator BaeR
MKPSAPRSRLDAETMIADAGSPANEPVLIVEDDAKIASVLVDYLQSNGYETHHELRGDTVEALVRSRAFSLVLLDIALPGMNGLDVCKRLRTFSSVPIVMLTARVEEIDRILGLELGADDYICKPFSPREVVARVKAILRRASNPRIERFADLMVDEKTRRATVGGQDLELTAVEFHLLKILVAHPGHIFTRSQLMDAMYADFRVVSERTVDSHIKKLRQKLAVRLGDADVIRSVYGLGYKYDG